MIPAHDRLTASLFTTNDNDEDEDDDSQSVWKNIANKVAFPLSGMLRNTTLCPFSCCQSVSIEGVYIITFWVKSMGSGLADVDSVGLQREFHTKLVHKLSELKLWLLRFVDHQCCDEIKVDDTYSCNLTFKYVIKLIVK